MSCLLPRQPVPELGVPTLAGTPWSLANATPQRFSLVVFYRGLHCPICATYVAELDKVVPDLASRGVEAIAVSSDTEARARESQTKWGLKQTAIGHSLTIGAARSWGLYISTSRGKTSTGIEEPALFNEPGVFLVRPDRTLYWASVQSMPFARPHFREILSALDFAIEKNYPARGEA
ncbi:MAG: AhpC/TSA family protein [Pseudomonadota bacterium]|nr:AhpC/TSA family protein [Pseudomonadota bacterium]